MLELLRNIFDYLLVIVGILLMIIVIVSIIKTPFNLKKEKKKKQELKLKLDNIVKETMEELKQEIDKNNKPKRKKKEE